MISRLVTLQLRRIHLTPLHKLNIPQMEYSSHHTKDRLLLKKRATKRFKLEETRVFNNEPDLRLLPKSHYLLFLADPNYVHGISGFEVLSCIVYICHLIAITLI